MSEASPSVGSGVARSEGARQSGCPVRFTHSVPVGAERGRIGAGIRSRFLDCPRRWNQGGILDGIRLLGHRLVELSMGHWELHGHRGDAKPGSGAQRPP